jgi:hypothetical protein
MNCSKIIWLRDLNYGLSSKGNDGCSETQGLLARNEWQALLEKDQVQCP